jgi:hypothetical protein
MVAISIGYLDGISSKLWAQRWVWIVAAILLPLPFYFLPFAMANESQTERIEFWKVGRFQKWPLKDCKGSMCWLPNPDHYFLGIVIGMNILNIITSFLGWYRIYKSKTIENKTNKSRIIMMRILMAFGVANLASWLFWILDEVLYLAGLTYTTESESPFEIAISQFRSCLLAFRGTLHALAVYYTLRAVPEGDIPRDSDSSFEEAKVKSFEYSKYGERTTISVEEEPELYSVTEQDAASLQWSVSEKETNITDASRYP